eukprot:2962564-Rhodomonas_salina.1
MLQNATSASRQESTSSGGAWQGYGVRRVVGGGGRGDGLMRKEMEQQSVWRSTRPKTTCA